jgi:DNA-binding transcriptional LysR family regulator
MATIPRVVVASPDYLVRHGVPATPNELVQHRIVGGTAAAVPTAWMFERDGKESVIPLKPHFSTNENEGAIAAAAGGRIIAQLWHTGAIAHPDMRGGAQPLSASDVNLLFESVTPTGRKPTVAPRPMSTGEIRQTVADYARAARNAVEPGSTAWRSSPTISTCWLSS